MYIRDGNGVDSDRVEPSRIQTQNPNLKPETAPNTGLGDNPNPIWNPVDPWNPIGYLKPEIHRQYKKNNKEFLATYAWYILHIHLYRQEAINNTQLHDAT